MEVENDHAKKSQNQSKVSEKLVVSIDIKEKEMKEPLAMPIVKPKTMPMVKPKAKVNQDVFTQTSGDFTIRIYDPKILKKYMEEQDETNTKKKVSTNSYFHGDGIASNRLYNPF